jgi:hypothetical protein
MLSAAVNGKKDGTTVRVSFVPAEAIDFAYRPLLSEAKFTLSSDSSSSLTRLVFSTGMNPFNLRGLRANDVQRASNELYQCGLKADKEQRLRCNRQRESWQWSALRSTWIPAVTTSVSTDIYPHGNIQDKTDATKSARAEGFGGVGTQLNLTFQPRERIQLELWGSIKRARTSGEPGTKFSYYLGGGVTMSVLAWSFFDRAALAENADYYHDGFIPGVALGASEQATHCNGQGDCAKGRTQQFSTTYFVDIRVKPSIQVRLSAPVTAYKSVRGNGSELAPVLTLAGVVDLL